MPIIRVAVAVIKISDRVLIAKRAKHQHQGGLWEFPGGKIEDGESLQQAIKRECYEELGITPLNINPLTTIEHHYSDKSVRLEVCIVNDFLGVAHGKEGQPLTWCAVEQLSNYTFPEANKEIIKLL